MQQQVPGRQHKRLGIFILCFVENLNFRAILINDEGTGSSGAGFSLRILERGDPIPAG
jgi:hypothetical protein